MARTRKTAGPRFRANLEALIARYNASGRVAFYHPRKRTVSLNGFPELPEAPAISVMLRHLGIEPCANCGAYVYDENDECPALRES